MLKIKNSALATSAVRRDQYPEEPLPAIALLGRSNAGKSSLINVMINRKNLARTSSAPGKTRLLNFYRIDGADEEATPISWHFVDLPGYGYAKVSKSERESWLRMMSEFLTASKNVMCWQLVDIRHCPSEQDAMMHRILLDQGQRVTVIANKADKISRGARAASLRQISQAMQVAAQDIVVFSAITREGREPLLDITADFLRGE